MMTEQELIAFEREHQRYLWLRSSVVRILELRPQMISGRNNDRAVCANYGLATMTDIRRWAKENV